MKKVFQTGAGVFGEGAPKVCIPIVAESRENIWKKAEEAAKLPADLVEWRADFYEDVFQTEAVLCTLNGLKERLEKKAVLFTFRTAREGGNREIESDAYYSLNELAANAGADLVDVEMYLDESRTAEITGKLRRAGCHVMISSHDFEKTPSAEEMVRRLKQMEELGADVAKLAVMPNSRQDVLNLLQATVTADECLSIPVVTMSMGNMGVVSRICGSLTGSAMTFASAGAVSAPGQIPVDQMTRILKII